MSKYLKTQTNKTGLSVFFCFSMNAFHIHTSQIVHRKYSLEYHVTKETAALRSVEQTKP